MDSKPRAPKMDRRTVARLDATVIDCADCEEKDSYKSLIEKLKGLGITVTFDQIEKSVHRLGLKWRDVFLPATRLERGHPDARANHTKLNATTSSPDMQAILDRIKRLEQTLTTNGLAEYKELRECIHSESRQVLEQALERAVAIQGDINKLMEWTQTLAFVANKVSRMENLLFSVFLHVVPQSSSNEMEPQQ